MNEIPELIDTEVDAVSGGLFDTGLGVNVIAPVTLAIGGPAISIFGGTAIGGAATGANLITGLNGIHF